MDLLTLYSVHCAVNDKIKGLIILNTDNVDKGLFVYLSKSVNLKGL